MKLGRGVLWALAGTACATPPAIHAPQSRRTACAVAGRETSRATLEDGSTVSIDPSGVAVRGRELMIVGSPVYEWPRAATPNMRPIRPNAIIGLWRDLSGTMRAVPSPLPGARVLYPRVASIGPNAWAVIFMTGSQGTRTSSTKFDTATVWFGHFNGTAWQAVHPVARVSTADLVPGEASALIARGGRLAFAFPFGELPGSIDSPRAPGIVMLTSHDGAWRQDTLRAWNPPAYVQLVATRDGSITAAIAESYFENHRTRSQSLFLARYDSAWHPAGLVAGDSASSIIAPAIREWKQGVAVAWQQGQLARSDSVRIEWMYVDAGGRRTAPIEVGRGRALDTFGIAALSHAGLLFAFRSGNASDSLRLVLASDSTTSDLGVVHVPVRNFAVIAFPQSDTSAMIVTGEVGSAANDPPAWSDLTHVYVHCQRGH